MNYITGPLNTLQNQLCLYTRVVWNNFWKSTRNVVLISSIYTAITNFEKWWIYFWKNKIRKSKWIMQHLKNMFYKLNEIVVSFNNTYKKHTTDCHLLIYWVFWWNILLWDQLRSWIFFQTNMVCQSISVRAWLCINKNWYINVTAWTSVLINNQPLPWQQYAHVQKTSGATPHCLKPTGGYHGEYGECWEIPNMYRVPNPIGKRVVPVIRPYTRPYLMNPQEPRGPICWELVVLVCTRGTSSIKMLVLILLVCVSF